MRQAFIIDTKEGSLVRIEESTEPDSVVLSVGFSNITVCLTEKQFNELSDLRYKVKFQSESVGGFQPPAAE